MTDRRHEVERSPADVFRFVVAACLLVVLLTVLVVFDDAVVGFASDLVRGLDAFGVGVMTTLAVVVRATTAGLLVGGLVVVVATRRWRAAATVVLAGAAGAVLFLLVEGWIDERRPAVVVLDDVAGPLTSDGAVTTVSLAVQAGALAAAAPWLSRRYRRIGWALVVATALVRFVAAPVSGLALAAAVSGWTAGALVLVLLGGPVRRPTPDAVRDGLASVGVELASLEPAAVDARGSTPYLGTTTDGTSAFVKVLGRDERSADLLFRLYRFVRRRHLGDERPFGSLRQAVEHEALLASMARSFGIRTPTVLALSLAEPGGVVIAYEGIDGRSLDRVDDAAITDEVLRRVWQALHVLRLHRLAHRDLRLANLFLGADGQVWIIDFGFGQLAASDVVLATDVAELVAALSIGVGPDRAIAAGRAVVGDDVLAAGGTRLRPAALSTATRTGLHDRPGLLEQIQREVGRAVAGG
jgi:undecaprenyl-diphosphatase